MCGKVFLGCRIVMNFVVIPKKLVIELLDMLRIDSFEV